jgi:hypothetical protein
MATALGQRVLAGILIGVSLFPPWLHAILTLPLGISLWLNAAVKEEEREQELAALNES